MILENKERTMQQIPLAEASKSLPELVETVIQGEEILILIENKAVAKITKFLTDTEISTINEIPPLENQRNVFTTSDDFNHGLEDIKDYM
jgi:antitoxin (DNA-binding transcriptional repressor) of toxin-antitoxin stability system